MGATASKVDGPLETLDADQVRAVVAGFGTQFAGAADKMREAGIDGDYLANACVEIKSRAPHAIDAMLSP